MKRTKQVKYRVQCAHNPNHIFEKVFEIEEGSENKETKIEAYCPFCDQAVTVTVKGKFPPSVLLRKFEDLI